MKFRYWLFGAISATGALNGATGSRVAVNAPDIYWLSEFPFFDFTLFALVLLALSWAALRYVPRYAAWLALPFLGLGFYGLSYGIFEAAFHTMNHRPLLASIALASFGAIVVSTFLAAGFLWGKRGAGV